MWVVRVQLFIDYQNLHLSVVDAFAPPGTPHHTTLIHPGLFGDALMQRRLASQRLGTLEKIHVYRGMPGQRQEPDMNARNRAQASNWTRDPRVTVYSRPLRYPSDWPNQRAKEKGVDVALAVDAVRCALSGEADMIIIASRDTDLLPALELADDLPNVDVEVCTWHGLSRLRFSGNGGLWCTYLQGGDYMASKDPTQY